jgi:hypothetical protein
LTLFPYTTLFRSREEGVIDSKVLESWDEGFLVALAKGELKNLPSIIYEGKTYSVKTFKRI